ncbi:MAG: hypothetical protein B7Z66_15575 [Chromatiales bacterium 21-64-14]|nr:MAG: hypothetical protein B7Z66_15575 [Chromatiales bacterium 21-64-14]
MYCAVVPVALKLTSATWMPVPFPVSLYAIREVSGDDIVGAVPTLPRSKKKQTCVSFATVAVATGD